MADGFPENAPDIRESDRQNLMKHILDAVKQCQVRFGGKTELATEKDSCIQCLLAQFENVFLHGLRKGKVWGAINSLSEPLRQVTGKVLSGLPDTEQTFWPFIKEFMVSSEIQRLMSLNNINTDSGRCRAWLRSCLNENSLERTLVAVLSDKNLLRQHYEDWALFNDEERSSTLPVMARGLGFIVFAIEIDSNQLNTQMKQPTFPRNNVALMPVESRQRNDPLPVIASRGENQGDLLTGSRKKRKKKVKQATISDIEVPEDEPVGNHFDHKKPSLKSSSRSTEDVKSAANIRTVDHSEIIKKFTQSHRRATSLESSDLNQQKKRTPAFEATSSASFEVPDFKNRTANTVQERKENEPKNVMSNKPSLPKPNESQKIVNEGLVGTGQVTDTKNINKSDNNVSSEYSNLMSKLANLSTSFKSSFSSGIRLRIGSREAENLEDKETASELTTSGSVENLLDEGDDVFTNKSKLEIADNSNGDSERDGYMERHDLREDKRNIFTLEGETDFYRASTAEVAIPYNPYSDLNLGFSERDTKMRSRNPSDSFDKILGQGDYLSPNDNAIMKMENVMKLKTPPSTPASANDQKTAENDTNLTSSGLEQKLQELTRTEDKDERCSAKGVESQTVNADSSKAADLRQTDENSAETASVNSSYTESVSEDMDIMHPVGFESEKFSEMVMMFDHQSSQAATDALQLLKTSSEMHETYDKNDNDHHSIPNKKYGSETLETSMLTSSSVYENDLSTGDLKQAILATARKKDEVDERNRVLQLAIDEEREYSLSLKTDLDNLREKHQETSEANLKKIEALSRENEVLRNQLKKYVAAVQLLKRENKNISKETNEAIGTLRGYSEESDVVLPPQPKDRSSSEMDSIYEEKLVQMSELHGELMEFHESLQRDLLRKQNQISKMKEELIELRGPLPNDLEESISDNINTSRRKPLINIWIPSVFIKGKGSDAHHLYQVYIRIGDEEWNIYRRYSQFHKMHIMCSKEHSEVDKFNFPPKKLLGKKDVKFVEGRRRKLQEYVRRLINFWITKNTELSELPNKENLGIALSFFSDEFNDNGKKKKDNSKRKNQNTAVYTGL